MRKLLFVALGIMSVGCIPAPTRMVVIGDSHAVPADAWPSAVDCMAPVSVLRSIFRPSLIDSTMPCPVSAPTISWWWRSAPTISGLAPWRR